MKIDLITGFLGAGKTTFIKLYAEYLMAQGNRICILENDYGAVNVDMMFLQDLLCDQCELEMVIGGDGLEAHRRRFKTKLISMAMTGYDRVLVEPSGVYDVDEFFDTLREEPLDRWYEPGNVISVVSAVKEELSPDARYLLASQTANAGCVILSKVQEASEKEIEETVGLLNEVMREFCCSRRFGGDVIAKDWNKLQVSDFERISSCGYRLEDHVKQQVELENGFTSLFYFYIAMEEEKIREIIGKIFLDPACGGVRRIKGIISTGGGKKIRINAVPGKAVFSDGANGTDALIVIGENMNREAVDRYLVDSSRFHGEL